MLVKSVDEREGDPALMIAAVDGIFLHVIEEVVHPTHVPFEAEAEATEIGRARDPRPCGRFLGDGDNTGKPFIADLVKTFEEVIASRFSRPPWTLGTHSPGLRE